MAAKPTRFSLTATELENLLNHYWAACFVARLAELRGNTDEAARQNANALGQWSVLNAFGLGAQAAKQSIAAKEQAQDVHDHRQPRLLAA